MRTILDSGSARGRILLPLFVGLLATPGIALSLVASFPDSVLMVWLMCAVLSVLGYWMYIHVYSIAYRWIGSWMGGQGNVRELITCLSWSQVPYIYIGLVFLPIHFIFRDVLYPEFDMTTLISSPDTILALTEQFSPTYYLINILFFVPCVYAYILSLKLMGEAHGFSAWKAFMVKLIAVVLHIPIFGVLFMVVIAAMVFALMVV